MYICFRSVSTQKCILDNKGGRPYLLYILYGKLKRWRVVGGGGGSSFSNLVLGIYIQPGAGCSSREKLFYALEAILSKHSIMHMLN